MYNVLVNEEKILAHIINKWDPEVSRALLSKLVRSQESNKTIIALLEETSSNLDSYQDQKEASLIRKKRKDRKNLAENRR